MRNKTKMDQAFIDDLTPATSLAPDQAERLFWDADQDGLAVRLRRNGDKRFVVHYKLANSPKKIFIGSTSQLLLADARHEAYEIVRDAKKDGADPKAERERTDTFAKVVIEYLAYIKPRLRPTTYRQNVLYLQKGDYFAKLRSTPIDRVTRKNVAECLRKIEDTHNTGRTNDGRLTANTARKHLSQLYTWANGQGLLGDVVFNPVLGITPPVDRSYKRSRERQRELSPTELANAYNGAADDRYGRILRLLALTGCRRREIGELQRSEVDLGNRRIVLPRARTKQKEEHTVYLAPAAVRILEAALADAPGEFLFDGPQGKNTGFQSWSDYPTPGGWTLHDLRRTMRTGLGRLGVPENIAELAIGHTKEKIKRIYDVGTYEQPLREAFEKWALHLEQLTGANVVNLRSA